VSGPFILAFAVASLLIVLWFGLEILASRFSGRIARISSIISMIAPFAIIVILGYWPYQSRDTMAGVGFMIFFAGIPAAILIAITAGIWIAKSLPKNLR
jgi:hypothetical protein